jgi:hypothetical protein
MSKIQSASSVAGKETIYVDVDDEITTIIDKVANAKGKVVALVLPKRATVLQSIVNMKLLKRTADSAGKNLVLVTSETGLMPLAGAVGLFVASTPTSKPSIPAAPIGPDDEPEDIDEPLNIVDGTEGADDEFDTKAASAKTVGELAAAGAAGKLAGDDIDESIDMGDDDDAPVAAAAATKAAKPKKNKSLKVPNFDSFKKKIALGVVALLLLIGGWILAFVVLPHATVTIKTDSATIPTNLNLTLNTNAKTLDTGSNVVPATAQSQQKTSTQTVPATGQQNNGQKASGTVAVTNCSGSSYTVSTGSSLTASGHTFIVQSGTVVPDSNYTHSGGCKNDGKGTVNVTALKGGAEYNIASSAATLSGNPSGVSAQTSAMTGGTDDITKIVSASDIAGATSKISADDSGSVKQQLVSGLRGKGLQAVSETFVAGSPAVTTSAKAGDASDNVTVTAVTTYTMLGVQKGDLKKLIENNVNGQLDKGKQVILDDGVANAQFTTQSPATPTGAAVSMEAKSEVGPDLHADQLKTQLAGKKSGDVKSDIKQTPGVTDVQVKLSPFWVNTVPKNGGKVTIKIVKAD